MAHYSIDILPQEVILHPPQHRFTLIWIHGLNQTPEMHLRYLFDEALLPHLAHFRIVLPRAPKRIVTVRQDSSLCPSWFDIKFRNEHSFTVDFDEAFSSEEVHDSYYKVLKPIIDRENKLLEGVPNRLMIGGFSQGCGMALHCFYESKQVQWLGVLGVSGYLFPISKFDKSNKRAKRIVYGNADTLRPWEYVRVNYAGKFEEGEIVLVDGMDHSLKKTETLVQMAKFITSVAKE